MDQRLGLPFLAGRVIMSVLPNAGLAQDLEEHRKIGCDFKGRGRKRVEPKPGGLQYPGMSGLIQLVYLSSAVELFQPEEIKALMAQAVTNNAKAGITGILLYKDGNFMQLIEGTESSINTLFNRISADPRHRRIMQILRTPIAEREFEGWSMAFRDLNSPEVRRLPGFSDYLSTALEPSEFESKPSRALRLLQSFHRAVR